MTNYLRLRQICLATHDLERAVADIQAIFDVKLAYRDPAVERYGLKNALFPFGLAFLEVVAPTAPDTAAGRFLERSGGTGGYMAIFNCNDPQRRGDQAETLGVPVVHRLAAPGFEGVQLHPRACRAAMIEFDRTPGEEDLRGPYHSAGPDWTAAISTGLTQGFKAIVLESPRPHELGAHWARIVERPFVDQGQGGLIAVDMCDIRFQPAHAAGREALSAIVIATRDAARIRAEAARRGYDVDDRGVRLCGVYFTLEG